MNTIERAVGLIRNYVASNRLAPDEARQTLPMPGRTDGHQSVILAFHLGESRPSKARKIWFPFLQAEALLPEFKISAKSITSDDFNLILPAAEPIGDLSDLTRYTVKEYVALRASYFALLSDVLDRSWLLGDTSDLPEQIRVAKEISRILKQISEVALEPYYALAAKSLRSWLQSRGHPGF